MYIYIIFAYLKLRKKAVFSFETATDAVFICAK